MLNLIAKKLRERVALFSWDIINLLSIPALVLWSFCYNLVISITLQVYPGMCQWNLSKGGLNANICMWLGGLQFHSTPAGSERRSKPLGIWMAAAPILFKTKWPQAPGSGPDYGFGRVHVLRKDKSFSLPLGLLHSVPKVCCGRCFPADFSTTAVPTVLESSPDRNWPPKWFKEIIPKIITCHWRDRPHHEKASVGRIQDVPSSCSELAVCTELLLSVWKC